MGSRAYSYRSFLACAFRVDSRHYCSERNDEYWFVAWFSFNELESQPDTGCEHRASIIARGLNDSYYPGQVGNPRWQWKCCYAKGGRGGHDGCCPRRRCYAGCYVQPLCQQIVFKARVGLIPSVLSQRVSKFIYC